MQQIADWLERLGLGQYAQRFAENDIDFEVLSDLTDQDLEKIGVASVGHRRKLLRAIANLKGLKTVTPAVAIAEPPATPRAADIAERRQVTVMFSDLVGPAEAPHDQAAFVQTRIGLHHLCFRAYAREDVDRLHAHLCEMGAKIVHPPEDGPGAPGYYSVLFEDPDGIRLEVNHVPGKGLLTDEARFNPVGYDVES